MNGIQFLDACEGVSNLGHCLDRRHECGLVWGFVGEASVGPDVPLVEWLSRFSEDPDLGLGDSHDFGGLENLVEILPDCLRF